MRDPGEQQGQMVETREGRVFQKVPQGQNLLCAQGMGLERRLDQSPKSCSWFSGVEAGSRGQGGQVCPRGGAE